MYHSWVDQYATPAVADSNGDGHPDLLALYHNLLDDSSNVYAGAFHGETLEPLWTYGPLGSQDTATGQVGLHIVQDRVVLLEPYGKLNLLDLGSGKPIAQFQLPENPRRAELCLREIDGTELLISDLMILDTATGRAQTRDIPKWENRPAHCQERRLSTNTTGSSYNKSSAMIASDSARPAPVERHKIRNAWIAEGNGVAVLETTVGSPSILLMGFEPATRTERWRVPISALLDQQARNIAPDFIDIGDNVIVFTYLPSAVSDDMARLVVLDAATGDKRLETPLARLGSNHRGTISGGHLWITGWTRGLVYIVDLEDGSNLVFGE